MMDSPRQGMVTRSGVVLVLAIAACFVFGQSGELRSQSPSRAAPGFDVSRVMTSGEQFEPFQVTETVPLRDALAAGRVQPGTLVLVTETKAGQLALLTEQMAFHHIAQGEVVGQPWMVSF